MILTTYLIVKDMTASLRFYEAYFAQEPGGGCPERFAVFNVDNGNLALYNPQYDEKLILSGADVSRHFNAAYLAGRDTPVTYGNNAVLNIGVEDLAAEYERVKALRIGAVSEIMFVNVSVPYYFFNLYDPDGNCLEITGRYGE
jgi:lactoylglutathione lyase